MPIDREDYLPKLMKPPIRVFRCLPGGTGLLIGNHWHDWYEVIYVEDGSILETVNGEPVELCKDGLVIVQPFDIHSTCSLSDDCSIIALLFSLSALNLDDHDNSRSKYLNVFAGNQKKLGGVLNAPYLHGKEIHYTLNEMVREFDEATPGYDMMLKGLLYQFISYIQRNECMDIREPDEQKEHAKIRSICAYIEQNYARQISVRMVAEYIGYSSAYLSRLFHKVTGQSIKRYIDYVRINEAALLLRFEDKTIGDVAEEVGFDSMNNFSRTFKRVMGTSPSSVRSTAVRKKQANGASGGARTRSP